MNSRPGQPLRGPRASGFAAARRRLLLGTLVLLTLAASACRESARLELLLLVSVDTLRADHLGSYGNPLGLTPNLDLLASEAQLFEFAYAPSSFTLPSVSAMMTGLYPEETGMVANHVVLPRDVPTLAGLLAAHGVRTGAAIGNWVLRSDVGLARGFAIYDDRFPDLEEVRHLPERIAASTTDAALEALDRLRGEGAGPVLLWVHYQDPHGPYTPPAGYRERYLEPERRTPEGRRELAASAADSGVGNLPAYQVVGEEREVAFYRAGYDGEVRYLDEEIGRLWQEIGARGLSERTALLFTADHGEGLGEDDYWFAHGELLTEPLVRVPLFLRIPGVAPDRRRDVASLLDLFPTVLALGGVAPPPGTRGRDLLGLEASEHSSSVYLATLEGSTRMRWGLVDQGYHYLLELDGLTLRESATPLGADPADREGPGAERLEALRSALGALRSEVSGKRPAQRQDLSDEERQKLRALGYDTAP